MNPFTWRSKYITAMRTIRPFRGVAMWVSIGAACAIVSALLLGAASRTPPAHPVVREVAAVRLPTGKLRTGTINATLRRSFSVFRYRPARGFVRASDAATSRGSGITFEASVPMIVDRWISRDGFVLGQTTPQNVEAFSVDGTEVAVLAGSQGVCMAASTLLPGTGGGYAAVCGSAASVVDRGLGFTLRDNSGISRIVGLVPNDNPTVAVQYSTGQTSRVPVTSNMFNAVSNGSSSIRTVSFQSTTGERESFGGGAG